MKGQTEIQKLHLKHGRIKMLKKDLPNVTQPSAQQKNW
jgi:hypothetical protein